MAMTRTLDAWLDALAGHGIKLRQKGDERIGPCLMCAADTGDGGTDRFRLKEGEGQVLASCRRCMDRQPDRDDRYRELVRRLWPDAGVGNRPERRKSSPAPSPHPRTAAPHTQAAFLVDAMREWLAADDEIKRGEAAGQVEQCLAARADVEGLDAAERERRKRVAAAVEDLDGAAERDPGDVDRRLRAAWTGERPTVELAPLQSFDGAPRPAPLIWRDDGTDGEGGGPVDAILRTGEVALLAGAGGLGKSTLALHLAASAAAGGGAWGGLRAANGPAVLVSYEDHPVEAAHRLTWRDGREGDLELYVWPDPDPLFEAEAERGGGSRPCSQWRELWDAVRRLKARLVVIDPASASLADASTSETGPVRAFLRALTVEAQASDCGVLVIAHSTKAGRAAVQRGYDPGAEAVAGSAAWWDAARSVLTLERAPDGANALLLMAAKANYGASGWGIELEEHYEDGNVFRGLRTTAPLGMNREAVKRWRSEHQRRSRRRGPPEEGESGKDGVAPDED